MSTDEKTPDELLATAEPCCASPRLRFMPDDEDFPCVHCEACGMLGHEGLDEWHAMFFWNIGSRFVPERSE